MPRQNQAQTYRLGTSEQWPLEKIFLPPPLFDYHQMGQAAVFILFKVNLLYTLVVPN